MAKKVLKWSHTWGEVVKGSKSFSHDDASDPSKMLDDWRSSSLGDLPDELGQRLPWKVIKNFSQLSTKVWTTPGYSWIDAADDFKVCFVDESSTNRPRPRLTSFPLPFSTALSSPCSYSASPHHSESQLTFCLRDLTESSTSS